MSAGELECVGVYGYVFAVQLHAEVCYAECQLQRAALTFLQVQYICHHLKVQKQLHILMYLFRVYIVMEHMSLIYSMEVPKYFSQAQTTGVVKADFEIGLRHKHGETSETIC